MYELGTIPLLLKCIYKVLAEGIHVLLTLLRILFMQILTCMFKISEHLNESSILEVCAARK
jgi:hypothetical protein